jgi:hypothetical protein
MAPKRKSGTSADDGDDGDDDGFTPRQLEQITELVSQSSNAAVSAHLKRKLGASIDEAITNKFDTRFDELKTMLGGVAGAKPDGDGEKKKAAGAVEEHPEIAALKARDAERERRLKAIEDERVAERRRVLTTDRDNKLREIAAAAGVDKNRIRGVVALLGSGVQIDEKTGGMSVKVQRDGYDEDATLEQHASEFFKSDEGKAYLAPPVQQRGGTGAGQRTTAASVTQQRGSSNSPVASKQAQQEQKIAEARENLQGALSELVGGGTIGLG